MLTADLVRVRQSGGELKLVQIDRRTRERALSIAKHYVGIVQSSMSDTRERVDAACADLEVAPYDRRLASGLLKLLTDRCKFEMVAEIEPDVLRREVFERAAVGRRALSGGDRFDRETVLAEIAEARGIERGEIDRLLYADLKASHVLVKLDAVRPDHLVDQYELGQAQAVLLRAVRLTAWVQCADPGAYRALFHKLKFLRLLYQIEAAEGSEEADERAKGAKGRRRRSSDAGYRITIDGPFSLFSSVSKYGLQLAWALPAIRACAEWQIEADVRWGKEKQPLVFRLEGRAMPPLDEGSDGARFPDEVAALLKSIRAIESPWRVQASHKLLHLPGVGLCVPDLVFTHTETRTRVYLEVMGYWSRAAVWRRVELVEAGLPHRILFAVSSRLRVSEEVLGDELPGALYVYKGVMNARGVLARVEALADLGKPDPVGATECGPS